MLLTLAQSPKPTITTGDDTSRIEVGIVINGANVAVANPTTVVKMALVSRDLKTILIASKPATLNVVSGKWVVPFNATETASLLVTPADPTSALKKPLLAVIDEETKLATAILEVEIGSPYQKDTDKYIVTVEKGMIL